MRSSVQLVIKFFREKIIGKELEQTSLDNWRLQSLRVACSQQQSNTSGSIGHSNFEGGKACDKGRDD